MDTPVPRFEPLFLVAGQHAGPQAIKVGRMLEDINAVFFEEPCPFDNLEATRKVTDALTIPVALGEQVA